LIAVKVRDFRKGIAVKRMGLTLIEFTLVVAIIVLAMSILFSVCPRGHRGCVLPNSVPCMSNLHQLSLIMKFYADDNNGQYPTTDKWCDLLAKSYMPTMEPELFICPGATDKITRDSNQSSYVLNKNIVGMKASEVPADVVLLFEGPVGWNQVGGPELLTTTNHEEEGAFLCFVDLSVKFVRPDELDELKWK
jgi:Tfp pilus assembly protein PilE